MITLNELQLPSPAALRVKVTPQAGTAQYNTLGEMVQDGMREKRTVEIQWTRMPPGRLAALDSALDFSGFIACTYPDPLKGSRTMNCRVTGHSARIFRYQDGTPAWADVKITLEEQ